MLRKMLRIGRKKVATGAESTASSSTSGAEAEGAEEDRDETEEEGEMFRETWIAWLRRTAQAVHEHVDEGKVTDWVVEQRRRKWRWAGHVARRTDGRWTKWMLSWEPVSGARAPGRPVTRWEDALVTFMRGRGRWSEVAKDRHLWRGLEDQFANDGFEKRAE